MRIAVNHLTFAEPIPASVIESAQDWPSSVLMRRGRWSKAGARGHCLPRPHPRPARQHGDLPRVSV